MLIWYFLLSIGYKVLALLDPSDEDIEKADMYIHVTFIKKWDICAGNGLLTALGGHMTTLKGEKIDHSGVAGNNGGLLASVKVDHQALVAKLPAWELCWQTLKKTHRYLHSPIMFIHRWSRTNRQDDHKPWRPNKHRWQDRTIWDKTILQSPPVSPSNSFHHLKKIIVFV